MANATESEWFGHEGQKYLQRLLLWSVCPTHLIPVLAFASVTLIISVQFALLLELCCLHHLCNKGYIMALSDVQLQRLLAGQVPPIFFFTLVLSLHVNNAII
ncbi:unnamed protein product [Prunus brigantina]